MDQDRVIRIREIRSKSCCRRPNVFLFACCLLVACLLLGLTSDLGLVWLEVDGLKYGLLACIDGPDTLKWTSWSCLEKLACYDGNNLCDIAEKGGRAGMVYTITAFLAYVFLALSALRLYIAFCRKDFGHPLELYLLLGLACALRVAGLTMWLVVTQMQITDCKEGVLCLSAGAAAALGTTLATLAASAYTACLWSRRDPFYDIGVILEHDSVLCLPLRAWTFCVVILGFTSFGLVVASYIQADWVTIEGLKGTLTAVERWANIKDFGYDCILSSNCSGDSDSGVCKTFHNLYLAALLSLLLDLLSLVCFVCWVDYALHLCAYRLFGVRRLAYLSIFAAFGLHTAAMVCWWQIGKIDFKDDCELPFNLQSRWDLCAGYSPKLGAMASASSLLTAVLWTAVYYNRPVQCPMSPRPANLDDSPGSPLSPEEYDQEFPEPPSRKA